MANEKNLKTFNELLYENEKKYADVVYLRQPVNGVWQELTWAETMQQARKITTFLKSLGLKKGDRVGIFSKNCAEWFITDFAIAMGGFVSVPFYAAQDKDTIQYILEHSEAKAIFVGKLDNWAAQEAGIPEHIIRIAFPFENMMPAKYQWNDILASNEPDMGNFVPDPEDLYTLIYTSGTTGNPKGVMVPFKAQMDIPANMDKLAIFNQHEHNFYFSFLPLGHIAERANIEYLSLLAKVTVAFPESLATFAKDLQEVQPTLFFAVPRIWSQFQKAILAKIPQDKLNELLGNPETAEATKKQLRQTLGLDRASLILTGAAPIAPSIVEWFEKLGLIVVEAYGRSEDLAMISRVKPSDRKIGTVGKAIPGVDIKISDDGELLTRSTMQMSGYYKDPEATKKTFTEDGFLHTGDMASIDSEGYLTILGRMKDPFKTDKGEFVNPIPIEGRFGKNSYIEQCCLIGMTLPQPFLIVILSEVARKLERKEVEKSLRKTLTSANKDLVPYAKVAHIIVAQEPWTPENMMLTPTLKLKRHVIHAKFVEFARANYESQAPILWE
jgi:long-chain acyl-CoA synthetase